MLKINKDLFIKGRDYLARLGRPSSIIGIDIGTNSVKAAQIVDTLGGWSLHKITYAEIPSVEEKDRPPAVVGALKEALSGMDTQKAKIVSVVSCPKTCTRNLITPLIPRQELAEAVHWEAKNSIPFPLEEAVLDFAVTGEVADKGGKKLRLMLAASPKETVKNLLSVFSQCGLKAASLIPVSEAMRSLLAGSKQSAVPAGRQGEETVAVVEMGAAMTELNIYRQAHLVFSRKLSVAARNITEALRSTLLSEQGRVELTLEEAERVKKTCGLPEVESEERIDGKISMNQVLSLIRPEVEQLVGDIEGSLDFYREESLGGKVDKILLFGGGAALKGLAAFLKSELGVEVSVGDAFGTAKILAAAGVSDGRGSHLFNLAVGAAMHGAESANFTDEENINLLPLELKQETKRFIEKVSLEAVATALVVITLLFYAGMRIQWGVSEKKLEAAGREYQSLLSQFNEYQMKILMAGARQKSPHWQEVLKELSHAVADRIYLVELNAEDNKLSLKGVIRGGEDAEVILSQFMLTLEKGLFKNVKLVTSKKREKETESSEFEIVCEAE